MFSLRASANRTQPDGGGGPAGPVAGPGGPAEPGESAVPIAPATMLARDVLKRRAMVSARVVADQVRCVECGICTYNCPLGIDVRRNVREGVPISDSACLTCGECVARCPRGTLRFEESSVFTGRPGGGR
jgi:heterodisulfide reductase subunit A-like polyferredoxin